MTDNRASLIDDVERLFQELTWRGRRHFARRVDAFGLTVLQYVALFMIGKLGPRVTMGDVADALQLPASTVTSVVSRLVRDGLVERGALPADRRAVVATLTAAGASLVAEIEAIRRNDLIAMLGDVADDDLAAFRRHLSWMLDGLDRLMLAPATSGGHEHAAGSPL